VTHLTYSDDSKPHVTISYLLEVAFPNLLLVAHLFFIFLSIMFHLLLGVLLSTTALSLFVSVHNFASDE
jgi:hypothetical protein